MKFRKRFFLNAEDTNDDGTDFQRMKTGKSYFYY
jgi:hypothetical protein